MQVYPELQGGRFIVIADFEDPKHKELFEALEVSDRARCVLDAKNGRPETGRGCLLFAAGSPDDALVISNAGATQWYLKRDWRPYDLLLMSVHAPQRNLTAEITIAAGPPERRLAAHTSLPVLPGWNTVRLDLAEIAERVPLDDIQEIRVAVAGGSKPAQFRLDDIVLTASREDLLGDSLRREAGLYVQRVGRRWKIGAAHREADFEITFANGQIVEWYNLAADPYRLQNLVRGTTLGPGTVVVGSEDTDHTGLEALGKAVVVRSQIVEMNSVRVVVTSEWRFVDGSESAPAGLDDRPFQRWVYTIYPTGQLYVGVETTAATESWSAPQLGLAVTLSSMSENELETYVAPYVGESISEPVPPYATVRSRRRDALLLFVPHSQGRGVRVIKSAPGLDDAASQSDRISLIATVDRHEANVESWACHVLLGATTKISEAEALARALAYARAATPELELGSFVSTEGGYPVEDGFDPVSGCYFIAPEQGRVRFTVDGTRQPQFSPAFCITGANNQDAWVYVDHLIFEQVDRNARGDLVFQLASPIRQRSLVEVLLRRREHLEGT